MDNNNSRLNSKRLAYFTPLSSSILAISKLLTDQQICAIVMLHGRKATASSLPKEEKGIMVEDKRIAPRIAFRAPLRYQVRGKPEFNDTISENISSGGIGFINSSFIVPQTLVMLEIGVLSRVLKSVGRIAWASSVPHSEKYRLGVEFMELCAPEQSFLKDFIDMQTGRL